MEWVQAEMLCWLAAPRRKGVDSLCAPAQMNDGIAGFLKLIKILWLTISWK